jgi:murein L,D-transpeptidase YcbB/YkuD
LATGEKGARASAPPATWTRRLTTAAVAAAVAGVVAWDTAQLMGPDGARRRGALAAMALHPAQALRERRAAAERQEEPRALWVRDGKIRPAAHELMTALAGAGADGLDPDSFGLGALAATVSKAEAGDRQALAQAPDRLSDALLSYVTKLRRPAPGVQVTFADPALAPPALDRDAVIHAAAQAPSLRDYLMRARPSNPYYEQLRMALAACAPRQSPRPRACGGADRDLLKANLERARVLPADLGARYILVNVPEQRLWVYEGGRPVDEMRVVVGKLTEPTPELVGTVRYALFNPYWNIPPDLARDNVAPAVLRQGPAYLEKQRLEVMSDWSDGAYPVDPATIDWAQAAAGGQALHVRQKPGPANMMGAVKFMLPNQLGIYLHDTPHREAFGRTVRAESSGCVRLEDAPRLARWLLGAQRARPPSSSPEARVDVPQPTPVYITYLTARADGGRVIRSPDLYNRDPKLLASLRSVQSSTGGAGPPAG